MRLRYFFGIVSMLCLFLGSCAKNTPTSTPMLVEVTPNISASNTPQATVTHTPQPAMDNPEYTLHLQLDYEQQQASVDETIKYQNQSGQEMFNLILAVEPNLWTNCFSLNEIRIDDQVSVEYLLDGQKLELSHTLTPMEIVTISISYTLVLPKIEVNDKATIIRSQVFGYTTRQLNMVDWYPFVVPYVPGQGWLLNEPATYGEHLVYDSASFDVMINFAGETIPVVAASGAEISSDAGKRFLLDKGRSFALSFSPDYLIKSQEVDGITVLSYYFAANALGGQAALDATVRALQIFSRYFGPYPHTSMSIVQEETAFSMEYDGLYFLERPLYFGYSGANTDFLPTIAAHETAHHWWFGLVGTEQANQPWVDEALATYSERLFNESFSPQKGEWWYLARISLAEENNCPVDISIYGFYDYKCFYTESVYMRGALFMQALRDRIGDQVFLDFLKDFATQFSFRRASSQDFFAVLRQHTDADLTDIIQNFFNEAY
ncbi:MAG: M1 family aminopeptidase [Chloroflexota bacterium]